MARRGRGRGKADPELTRPPLVKGADLEPIDYVERELTSPDGETVTVKVPVYPPFRLETRPEKRPAAKKKAPARRTPAAKRKTG